MILMTIFSFWAQFSTEGNQAFTLTLLQNLVFCSFKFYLYQSLRIHYTVTVISLFHQNMKLCSAWTLPEINLLLKCFYTDPQHYY